MEQALPRITHPFVLVCSDGDASVPDDIPLATVNRLISSPYLLAFYSQNMTRPGGKLHSFPIGIDLHSAHSPEERYRMLRSISPATARTPQVYCDLYMKKAKKKRFAKFRTLIGNVDRGNLVVRKASQLDTWQAYATSEYVVSLPGNGWATHRMYEALYLGAKVVTVTSPLDGFFQSTGWPITILSKEEFVAQVENIAYLRSLPAAKLVLDRNTLTPKYWRDKMLNHF